MSVDDKGQHIDSREDVIQSNSLRFKVDPEYGEFLAEKWHIRKQLLSQGFPSGNARDMYERMHMPTAQEIKEQIKKRSEG